MLESGDENKFNFDLVVSGGIFYLFNNVDNIVNDDSKS